jgi:predicted nucleic acid-binding protein
MTTGPLVDTSVLIDYFAGVRNRESDALDRLLADGPPPCTAPVIVQEFLQGFPGQEGFAAAREHIGAFWQLKPPGYAAHEGAARLHLELRRSGLTVPTIDALIVAMARDAGCALLTRDHLQRRLARHAGVPLG